MSNPWFRFYTEAVDDEKLRLLAFEDRWHYVALLCCKGNGILDSDCSPDMLRRKLSVKLGLALRDFDEAMRRLSEVDLIDPETFQPYGWDNRQFVSDSSTDRTRKWREKQRLRKAKRECDVTVTVQDTDTDTDTDMFSNENTPLTPQPIDEAFRLYNEMAERSGLSKAQKLTETRKKKLRARLKDAGGIEGWRFAVSEVENSTFLKGANDRGWKADLDFMLQEASFTRLMEGSYRRSKKNARDADMAFLAQYATEEIQ